MTANEVHDALVYLQKHGMTNTQLDSLHHKKSRESFSAALKYWSGQADRGSAPRGGSIGYGQRLLHVMRGHRQGRAAFPQLIEEARQKWPPAR
ncbi:MAG: hypothetical protein JKP98_07690 [Rhodobacteraceae bacterium]|jgi:hypothetical protein|nr:hypothetical protein [Paracoccaceae bacterium]MBL4557064.1 hypothetical protein [Paracoccaceae bacterium]